MAGGIAGHLAMMRSSGKLSKPSLQVNAYVNVGGQHEPDVTQYDKEELKRTKAEVAGIEQALENWVPEDVAARAKRSLEIDLRSKKARVEELKARISARVELEEPKEEDDEEEED
jgi:hypothetical protein